MKVAELKKLLEDIPDDFEITTRIAVELSEKTSADRSYPYPYDYIPCGFSFADIGYSDKVVSFMCDVHENDFGSYYSVYV